MTAMIALEKIIKELELHVSVAKGQLHRHNSGEENLSLLAQSSAENSLEKHLPLLEKYRNMLKEFEKFEKLDSYSHRRLRAAIQRKKYYKYNKIKNSNSNQKQKFRENDERIEAAMIIDELPEDIVLDNVELFDIASKNLKKLLKFKGGEEEQLNNIQKEFNSLINGFTDENIKSLELLNYMIPILIFHFYILKLNIIEQHNDENAESLEVDVFPKYDDWWIDELWESHIAYFSLLKWKTQIKEKCVTDELKKGWKIIFNNWIFIKTLINEKSDLAFEYQLKFDSLLFKYANLESQLDENIVNSNKEEIKLIIEKGEYFTHKQIDSVFTPYIQYKVSNKKNL